MTPVAEPKRWQEQKATVDRFVARFGNESYRLLAYHAALPLVLTPELVNYLRNEFLRGEEVPWEAEVDLLLSDLCSQVSYELYAMDTQVRAYLLEEIKDSPFWQQRMREVAQVLISYVNFLSRVNPEQRQQELEAQRLAAMVYLGDEACQKAAQEIVERFRQVSDSAEQGKASERGIRAELAQISRITQDLAPQLPSTLIEYAKLVQRVLRNPETVDATELRQVYQVGNAAIKLPSQVFPSGQKAEEPLFEEAGFPPLAILNFETAQLVEQGAVFPALQMQTIESVTLFFENELSPPRSQEFPVLQPFSFEIATIERDHSAKEKWKINRRPGAAQLYEERLGNALSLEMVAIPAGRFMMGSLETEPQRNSAESPQHEVQINDFYMGKYPVTQAQWKQVAAMPQVNRELNSEPSRFKGDKRPVEQVSWYEAVEFCERLSAHTKREYRLPTEAEWEYACRAGTITSFHFGETITTDLANYRGTDNDEYKWSGSYDRGIKSEYRKKTTFVDQFGVANAFGLCDMHGNVYEWCQDHWHDNYNDAPADGSAWLNRDGESRRLLRGGSWHSYMTDCWSAYRYYFGSAYANGYNGFRVVCSALTALSPIPF